MEKKNLKVVKSSEKRGDDGGLISLIFITIPISYYW